MTDFNSADHPRVADGTFTEKTQSQPEVTLDTVSFEHNGLALTLTPVDDHVHRVSDGTFSSDFFVPTGTKGEALTILAGQIYDSTKRVAGSPAARWDGGDNIVIGSDFADIEPGDSRWFDSEDFDDPFISSIEVCRTSEETAEDNGGKPELWAEATVRIDLHQAIPFTGAAGEKFMNDHSFDVDQWIRDNYSDARFVDPFEVNWYDAEVKASVDTDDCEGAFPSTINGVLEAVRTKTKLSDLASHVSEPNREATGGFIDQLRSFLLTLS